MPFFLPQVFIINRFFFLFSLSLGPRTGSSLPTTGKRSGGSGRTADNSPARAPAAAPITPAAALATSASGPAMPAAASDASAAAPTTPADAPAAPAPAAAASALATALPPQRRPSLEKLSLVTLSKFNLLENTVADLKERVYGTSPTNEVILQEVRYNLTFSVVEINVKFSFELTIPSVFVSSLNRAVTTSLSYISSDQSIMGFCFNNPWEYPKSPHTCAWGI